MGVKTQEEKVLKLMKSENWYSNFQMQQNLKSSSADRAFRRLREKGLDGYVFQQRPKKNSNCLEYRIVKLKETSSEK